jgi:hypothetical protein
VTGSIAPSARRLPPGTYTSNINFVDPKSQQGGISRLSNLTVSPN